MISQNDIGLHGSTMHFAPAYSSEIRDRQHHRDPHLQIIDTWHYKHADGYHGKRRHFAAYPVPTVSHYHSE